MISGGGDVLTGEAVFFGSLWFLAWAALFAAIDVAYFLLAEEPGLERRFGDESGPTSAPCRAGCRVARWDPVGVAGRP